MPRECKIYNPPDAPTARESYRNMPKEPTSRDVTYRKPGEKEPDAGEPLFGTNAIAKKGVNYYGE